ncbi:MAG: RidA family protein [Actinomycetota bacterium]|nr:RidA family protein [Actinomycetota bacterium]
MGAERPHAGSDSPFEERYGFSRAVRVGDRVLVSGTAPVWPDGTCDPDAVAQMHRCCEIAVAALGELDAGPADVVRTRMFVTDATFADAVGAVHGQFFGAARPAATMVVVAGLLDPRWRVELEVEAVAENRGSRG